MPRPRLENPSKSCLKARRWKERHPEWKPDAGKNRAASLKWRNANLEKARNNARDWHRKHPIRNREKAWREQGMNFSWSDYLALLTAQEYRCANEGCGAKLTQSSPVDHDHETGAVRGVLCTQCNAALGMVADSQEKLLGLSRYLASAMRSWGGGPNPPAKTCGPRVADSL